MNLRRLFSGTRTPLVAGILVFIALAIVSAFLARERHLHLGNLKGQKALVAAGSGAADLEHLLHEVDAAITTLSIIETRSNLTDDFDTVAQAILAQNSNLLAIGIIGGDSDIRVFPHTYAHIIPKHRGFLLLRSYKPSTQTTQLEFQKADPRSSDSNLVLARLPLYKHGELVGLVVAAFDPARILHTVNKDATHYLQVSIIDTSTLAEDFVLRPMPGFDTGHAGFITMMPAGTANAWRVYAAPIEPASISGFPILLIGTIISLLAGLLVRYLLILRREADNNYKLLVEQALVGVYIFQNGRFVYVNPKMAALFGYTQDEMLHMDFVEDIVYPEDRDLVLEQVRLRESGEKASVHYEMRGRHRDGAIVWTEVLGARTSHKGTLAVLGTLLDITERKTAELSTLYEKNLSDTIINGLPGVFYIAERNGKLVRWNRNFERLVGCSTTEMSEKFTTDFILDEQLPIVKLAREQAFETGHASDEITVIAAGNVLRTYYVTIMPIDYKGVERILGIAVDFTDKKKAEEELVAKTAEVAMRQSELEALFENIEGAASLLDTSKRYVIFNKQFIEDHTLLTGIPPHIGMEVYAPLADDLKLERHKMLDRVLQGKKEAIEVSYVREGKRVFYRTSFMPVISNGVITGISTYSMNLTEIKEAEQSLRKTNYELGERVKELKCLYGVSELANNERLPLEVIMHSIVNLIPAGWQFPEITCARLDYLEHAYRSDDFKESDWQQEASIVAHGNKVGRIAVYYREQRKEASEGPFLAEERQLINSIAEMIGGAIEKKVSHDEITKLGRLYQFSSAINEMVLRAADEQTIYNEACEIAVAQGKYRMAWIGSADLSADRFVPFAHSGYEAGYLNTIRPSINERQADRGPLISALRTRTHHYNSDIADSTALQPWRKEALKRGYRATISLPIVVDAQLVGLFSLYRSEPFAFNEVEIRLLVRITENISYALDKLRTKAAKQQYTEKLSESEELFRKLTEETPVGVYILQDRRFCYVNPGFERITGYSKDQLAVLPFEKLLHEDDVATAWERYLICMNGEQPTSQYIFKGVSADGAVRHVQIITSLIRYHGQAAILGTAIDITERVEEEKRFSLAVTEAQENERMAIGMELHDNAKQMLATALLGLHLAKTTIDDKAARGQYLDGVQQQIRQAVTELRRISHRLAPSIDTTLPFEEKITALVAGMNLSEALKVDFEFSDLEKPMSNSTQLALYRIVQEQFTNILKYADASVVKISMTGNDVLLTLTIADNGVGFDLKEQKFGIGLENIARRAKALNGVMQIVTEPSAGCILSVTVPFD